MIKASLMKPEIKERKRARIKTDSSATVKLTQGGKSFSPPIHNSEELHPQVPL